MEQYAELCDKKLTEKYWKWIQSIPGLIKCYGEAAHGAISNNPNITWEIVEKNLDSIIKWKWKYISKKKSVTWDIIQNNPHIKWVPRSVSINPNITPKNINPVRSLYVQNVDREY